jgi:multiple sugar transport system permease protein/fructooligosaccharide transport system permease protein
MATRAHGGTPRGGRCAPRPQQPARRALLGLTLLLGAGALLCLAPLLFMLMASLKPSSRMLADLGSWRAFWPAPFQPHNYVTIFTRIALGRYLLNSLAVALITVCGSIVVNSLAAYAFAVLRFPGRDLLFAATVALIIVPFEAIFLPLFLTVNRLGWLNSYQALIVPFIANAFYIFLFRQFFLGIPRELLEAARLDGASFFRIYRSLALPLARPAIATVAIIEFVARWNDFFWPFLTLTDATKYTAQLGLATFFQGERTQWALVMATATVVSLPVLALFLLMQRAIVSGVAAAGRRF